MTIGKRLMLSVLLMLGLSLGIGYFCLTAIGKLGTTLAANAAARRIELLAGVRADFQDMIAQVKRTQLSYLMSNMDGLSRGRKGLAAGVDGMACSMCHTAESGDASKGEFQTAAGRVDRRIAELRPLIEESSGKAALDSVRASVRAWMELDEEYLKWIGQDRFSEAHGVLRDRMNPLVEQIDKTIQALASQQGQYLAASGRQAQDIMTRSRWTGSVLLALCLLVGAALPVVVRRVTKLLRDLAAELREGAGQVARAAAHVSGSSQALAKFACSQASSLEQTSASSEEINSMAHRNSDNSRQAAALMAQAQERLALANDQLNQMVLAMEEIDRSSGKISKIIKVVDEIAFQTNILALNAAVEAARAGEAGMGFAVVADEVRNLAQRCAAAAGDIASLIEDSLRKSSDGKAKVDQVTETIRGITAETTTVKSRVDEINLGSGEQTRGIEQVGKAIADMELVTQQTAESAQESASAGTELTRQSEALNQIVHRMALLVGGD